MHLSYYCNKVIEYSRHKHVYLWVIVWLQPACIALSPSLNWVHLIASLVIKNMFSDSVTFSQMVGQEMVNSLPGVAPAKAPPAQQHVRGESLQSITSSL